MNKTPSETKQFLTEFKNVMPKGRWCDIAFCVPAVCIPAAVRAISAADEISVDLCDAPIALEDRLHDVHGRGTDVAVDDADGHEVFRLKRFDDLDPFSVNPSYRCVKCQ